MDKAKKVLKKPTGEFSKTTSKLAQKIANTKSNKLNPVQARVAAGKFRDTAKKTPFKGPGAMDASGAALSKAIAATKKPAKKIK